MDPWSGTATPATGRAGRRPPNTAGTERNRELDTSRFTGGGPPTGQSLGVGTDLPAQVAGLQADLGNAKKRIRKLEKVRRNPSLPPDLRFLCRAC